MPVDYTPNMALTLREEFERLSIKSEEAARLFDKILSHVNEHQAFVLEASSIGISLGLNLRLEPANGSGRLMFEDILSELQEQFPSADLCPYQFFFPLNPGLQEFTMAGLFAERLKEKGVSLPVCRFDMSHATAYQDINPGNMIEAWEKRQERLEGCKLLAAPCNLGFVVDAPGSGIGQARIARHLSSNHFDTPTDGYLDQLEKVLRKQPLSPTAPRDTDTLKLWQIRELYRFKDGTYTALPDKILEQIPPETLIQEIPHMAIKGANAGKVAYTENPGKGAKDVQSVARPGRYLRRVLQEQVDDESLKQMVSAMNACCSFGVKFAESAEEIAEVYMTGPDSCMAHGEERFDETFDDDGTWYHPMEVFGHPDCTAKLVYVETQGRPAARALINTANKRFPSFYVADWAPHAGDVLRDWLRDNDYRMEYDALDDVILSRIDLRNGRILCPYIDSQNRGVEILPDKLIVNGPFKADYDDGFVEEDEMAECDNCHDHFPEDDGTEVEEDVVCPHCAEDTTFAFVNGSDHPERIWEANARVLNIVAENQRTSRCCDAVHDDFDEWDRLDVVPDINDEVIFRPNAHPTPDGEYVHRDEVTRDYSPGTVLYEGHTYILHEGVAYEPSDLWYDEDEGALDTRDNLDEALYDTQDNITYRRRDLLSA